MKNDDTSDLTQLGSKSTEYKYDEPDKDMLETFPNQFVAEYKVELYTQEMSSLCPKTGQPDFATITVEYIPDKLCVETKSYKLYMFAYRDHASFMETITNKIKNDLVMVLQPKWLEVRSRFNPRGGIYLNVTASYGPISI